MSARSLHRRGVRTMGAAILFAAALIAGGCGSDAAVGSSAQASGSGSAATADGGQIEWASLEGTDTVLWFWAPW